MKQERRQLLATILFLAWFYLALRMVASDGDMTLVVVLAVVIMVVETR